MSPQTGIPSGSHPRLSARWATLMPGLSGDSCSFWHSLQSTQNLLCFHFFSAGVLCFSCFPFELGWTPARNPSFLLIAGLQGAEGVGDVLMSCEAIREHQIPQITDIGCFKVSKTINRCNSFRVSPDVGLNLRVPQARTERTVPSQLIMRRSLRQITARTSSNSWR